MGATRPPAGRLDQSFDVVRGAFEHRFDAPVATVANPARDPVAQRRLPESVPEEHALNEPVSYDASPLHSHIVHAGLLARLSAPQGLERPRRARAGAPVFEHQRGQHGRRARRGIEPRISQWAAPSSGMLGSRGTSPRAVAEGGRRGGHMRDGLPTFGERLPLEGAAAGGSHRDLERTSVFSRRGTDLGKGKAEGPAIWKRPPRSLTIRDPPPKLPPPNSSRSYVGEARKCGAMRSTRSFATDTLGGGWDGA